MRFLAEAKSLEEPLSGKVLGVCRGRCPAHVESAENVMQNPLKSLVRQTATLVTRVERDAQLNVLTIR